MNQDASTASGVQPRSLHESPFGQAVTYGDKSISSNEWWSEGGEKESGLPGPGSEYTSE